MNGENQPLVINEPVEFEKQLIQIQDYRENYISVLEEFIEYSFN